MKYATAGCLFTLLLGVLLGGCDLSSDNDEAASTLDVWMVGATNDAAIRNAIVRQSTLFPYQFEQNSAQLNNLGARDIVVLATHFRSYPGELNIRRGTESKELYDQRVKNVIEIGRASCRERV